MNMVIQRIFGVVAPRFSDSIPSSSRLPFEHIQQSLRSLLHDCQDMQSQRVIYKINIAESVSDLWLLRSDLHQCISQRHNQAEAATRINSLVEVFQGWLPARQLTRI